MKRLWQWLVTEIELRFGIMPPTYPCVMERRLREILGEAQYQMLRYVYPVDDDCEDNA